MNLLQFLLIITWVIFFFFAIDSFQRKKLNLLHFIVFFWWSLLLLIFTLLPNLLNQFWSFFWLSRWADLIVYSSIIILFYLYFELLNSITRNKAKFTSLSRELTLQAKQWDLKDSTIAFVIPSYNEDERAIEVVKEVLDKWYWVVYIDDWSKNYTYRKLKSELFWNKIVFLRHAVNMWQWGALETWFEYLRRHWENIKYTVTYDSDWQHRLEDLPNFLKAFEKDPTLEIVLWSRFLWSAQNLPTMKKIILKLWIIFTLFFSWIKLSDTHNGYRVLSKSALEKIRISMNWMEHASEIIDIITEKKIKYAEVPIVILYTEYSMRKWQKISNAFKIAANMIYRKFFYK
jgi:hypothetical protein